MNGALKTALWVGAGAGVGYVIWLFFFKKDDSVCGATSGAIQALGTIKGIPIPQGVADALCPLGNKLLGVAENVAGSLAAIPGGIVDSVSNTVGKIPGAKDTLKGIRAGSKAVPWVVGVASLPVGATKGVIDTMGNLFGGD